MNAFSYIKNNVYVKLKPSKLQGIGVFALRDIPQGVLIFEKWAGDTGSYSVPEKDLEQLPRELYKHIKDIFLYSPNFPIDTNTYITLTKGCHWVYTTPYYFVNSSTVSPNLDKDTQLTLRPIKKGEEILSNYGRYERALKEVI